MDLNVTLVLIGVDIAHSGLLRDAYIDPATRLRADITARRRTRTEPIHFCTSQVV